MSKPIIEFEGLGKSYRIGANREKYLSLRNEMAKEAHGFYRRFLSRHRHVPKDEEFWALKDVTLSVTEGEALGIIGRNGAGKSTLLKLLSKITPPTEGKITLRGRVASLLEVGTGFHPELTGRENIFLNGAILGMRREEIRNKFDDIVAFAEVEAFLDTPLKRYSSGMYVRLAFAVAAHLEPEILIVDEVLAVGDVRFQKRCLGRMAEVAQSGRTVLFVSHNMGMIAELCGPAVWLDGGRIRATGKAAGVIARYQHTNAGAQPVWTRPVDASKPRVSLQVAQLRSVGGAPIQVVDFAQPFQIEILYDVYEPVQGCTVSFRICNAEALTIMVSSERDSTSFDTDRRQVGHYTAVCTMPGGMLRHGAYYLSIGAYIENRETIDQQQNVLAFEVSPIDCPAMDGRAGVLSPILPWSVRFTDHTEGSLRG